MRKWIIETLKATLLIWRLMLFSMGIPRSQVFFLYVVVIGGLFLLRQVSSIEGEGFWHGAARWAEPIVIGALFIPATLYLVGEFLQSRRVLLGSIRRHLSKPRQIGSLIVMMIAVGAPSATIVMNVPYVQYLALGMLGVPAIIKLGMIAGYGNMRGANYPNRAVADERKLAKLYENSLNPNLQRAHGLYVFLIVPMFILACTVDARLVIACLMLQFDNVYTRLRMLIIGALFLLTRYEESSHEWILFKLASAEFAISSMVADGRGEVPEEVPFQQDVVRIHESQSWLESVRFLMRVSPLIIVDTHSHSDALGKELSILEDPAFSRKIMFVYRDGMDAKVKEAGQRISAAIGGSAFYSPMAIARILRRQRDHFMSGMPMPPHMMLGVIQHAIGRLPNAEGWKYGGLQYADLSQLLSGAPLLQRPNGE